MSFQQLANSVGRKFNELRASLPDVESSIKNALQRTVDDIKSQSGFGQLEEQLKGMTAGLNVGELTSQFASTSPEAFKSNLPARPTTIAQTTEAGTLVPGESAPPWPNELEPFASHNCIFTLACLSQREINDPVNTYRKDGFKHIISKSGGYNGGRKAVRTQVEVALGAQVEFFINNFALKSVMTPSSYGRNSNVTELTFDVLEPYSMGLFFQALKVAALEAGYADYTLCPFALQLDFVGFNVDGEQQSVPYARRIIPIRLRDAQLKVDGAGSSYTVSAIAWNEQALVDSVQQIKTDLNIKGRTVRELLQTGGESLTELLNKRIKDMVERNQIASGDQYVILFPRDTSSVGASYDDYGIGTATDTGASATSGGYDDIGATRNSYDPIYSGAGMEQLYQSIVGTQAGQAVPETFGDYYRGLANGGATAGQIEFMMKKYAASDHSNNIIAQCAIIEDPVEAGVQPMNPPAYTGGSLDGYAQSVEQARTRQTDAFRSEYAVFNRTNPSIQISDDVRGIRFKAGTRIQEIIEEVVISSIYGRGLASQLNNITDPEGMVTWYRVETDEYIIPDEAELARSGNYPLLHVYRVVPYKVTMDFFKSPSEATPGLTGLKSQAAKQYNYIYTGKNKDVLDFEIQFNSSFIYPVNADRGSGNANASQGATNQMTAGAVDAQTTQAGGQSSGGSGSNGGDAGGANREAVGNSTGGQSAGLDNSAIQVARQFNDRLMNSQADMLNVEMTIMGDPFYLSDGGYGNYHAQDTSYTNMNADGHMNHTNGFVHINIMFRTPVDLRPDQGDYIFPEDLIVIDQFSGIYRVNEVEHLINDNVFTQRLVLNRVQHQEEQPVRTNLGALVPIENPTQALNDRTTTLQNQISEAAATIGQEANYETYLREVQSLLPGFQSLQGVVQGFQTSLNGPALEAFGKVGEAFTGLQSSLNLQDLTKIGADFSQLQGAVSQLESITSGQLSNLTGSLSSLDLGGANVLGRLGTDLQAQLGQTVGQIEGLARTNLPNLAAGAQQLSQLPTAIEAESARIEQAVSELNAGLRDRIRL